jgi:hypothetical protein
MFGGRPLWSGGNKENQNSQCIGIRAYSILYSLDLFCPLTFAIGCPDSKKSGYCIGPPTVLLVRHAAPSTMQGNDDVRISAKPLRIGAVHTNEGCPGHITAGGREQEDCSIGNVPHGTESAERILFYQCTSLARWQKAFEPLQGDERLAIDNSMDKVDLPRCSQSVPVQ